MFTHKLCANVWLGFWRISYMVVFTNLSNEDGYNSASATAWALRVLAVGKQLMSGCDAVIPSCLQLAASTDCLERTSDWSECWCLRVQSFSFLLDLMRICWDRLLLFELMPVSSLMSSQVSQKISRGDTSARFNHKFRYEYSRLLLSSQFSPIWSKSRAGSRTRQLRLSHPCSRIKSINQ